MASYRGISDVGIAEVTIPGVEPVRRILRPPVDLLDAAGSGSISRPLSYVFTRRANNQRGHPRGQQYATVRRQRQ